MSDHNRIIRTRLVEFSKALNVPAVGGGIVYPDGSLSYDVCGVKRRGGGEAVRPQDQWHIGSCAKSITAVLYARLVENGDADWHSPVASLFPDLRHEIDEGWSNRTVAQLFWCRAGMKANPGVRAMLAGWSDTRPLADQRSEVARIAMQKPPGPQGRFAYSNLSYMVVGAAIDRITGLPYEEALAERVLAPLGITSAGYGPPPEIWGHKARVQIGNLSLLTGTPADPQNIRSDNPGMLSSAGTLHLTLEDWARFLHLFLNGGGDLLQSDTIDFLLQPPDARGARMAMGWATASGLAGVSHGVQRSNTMWAAAALLNESRTRLSFVVCNDGRTRVVGQCPVLAATLLDLHFNG